MKGIGQGQVFKNFAERNRIYIDKTEQINNLLMTDRIFISRPRRFGKSLLLDTIGVLFEEGVEPYFKDTWIYDKWTESKYPVLRLNFLEYTAELEDFKKLFCADIWSFAKTLNIEDEITTEVWPVGVLSQLLKSLNRHNIKIVILIDEYDSQLTANINNPEIYTKFQELMRNMYANLKGNDCIRFLGITGVTRLKDVSIFSVGTDIKDLSYFGPVSTIVGFTRAELKKYYIDYINLAVSLSHGIAESKVIEEQREELLDKLAEEYDGYCFDDEYENKVYSTWSVNSFFQEVFLRKKVRFGDYWYDNGGIPSILAKYLETHEIQLENYLNDIDIDIDDFLNPSSLLDMKQEVLLCQTGYLTVHSTVPDGGIVTLGLPNKEIKRSLFKLLSRKIFKNYDFSQSRNEEFFSKAQVPDIVARLNSALNGLSYESYKDITEATIQGFLYFLFIGCSQDVRIQTESAVGRSDIEIHYPNRCIIFELKYAPNEESCEGKLQQAVEQIISRRYGDTLLNAKKEVIKIALVFNGDKKVRQFTHYKVVA